LALQTAILIVAARYIASVVRVPTGKQTNPPILGEDWSGATHKLMRWARRESRQRA